MEKFDLLNVPLRGANLLEAAAGTGKTFAIEGLFLRLIMEQSFSVGEILVVTYTVAATEELRDRIRRRLRAAAAAFTSGESADPLLAELLRKFPDPLGRRLFQERLKAALRDFDEAAIFTIHSFCQRILQENAFESDSLFDMKLIADERALREEIVDDFWRSHFYETLPEIIGYALSHRFRPDYLHDLLTKVSSHPLRRVIPETIPSPLARVKDHVSDFNKTLEEIRSAWPGAREEVCEKLSGPALHAGVYGNKAACLMEAMDGFINAGGPYFPLFPDCEKFTTKKIAEKVKKNHTPPEHVFFGLCQSLKEKADALAREMDAYLLFLKKEFIAFSTERLAAVKAKDNLVFFNDLLTRVRDALMKRGGEELRQIIGKKYRAALIDEFQDTDPVQFAIFQTVFGQGAAPPALFLIGDPKQAIYGFRGADIFAYMKAARDIKGKYHITENWRSEPGLIGAVNTLFSARDNPFVFSEISFWPAEEPQGKTYDFLTINGRQEPPLQWWFVPAEKCDPSNRPLSQEKAAEIIPPAVAGEIGRLLLLSRQGLAMLGKRPLREDDIAVLVRKHREARLIQQALQRLNIPSVLQKSGNIFDTEEAEELERIMMGIAMPEEERLVRAALLTRILGVTVQEMGRLAEDAEAWGIWLEKFGYYHNLWLEAGFMGMFTALMTGQDIKVRLLIQAGGERRITNLLHLAELLTRIGEEQKFAMLALLNWLAKQRNPATLRLDEHQLRLESDELAVRIVTVHQSKGLEYPVVFCPFTWEGSEVRGDIISFHEKSGDAMITFDLGSEQAGLSRQRAAGEQLAENVRLLYVALTRAKNRCYFIWGRFNRADTSAPAYLFHAAEAGGERGNSDDLVDNLSRDYKCLTDNVMYGRLEDIAASAQGKIALLEIPAPEATWTPPQEKRTELTFRQFSGKIDRTWRINSFSSLVAGQHHLAETPDYDASLDPGGVPTPPAGAAGGDMRAKQGQPDIFSFPRGARAGTLLHDILRRLDFQETDGQVLRELVSQKLSNSGFDPLWEDTLLLLLKKTVSLPLPPCPGSASDTAANTAAFTLAEVPQGERLNELEFYFPLRRLAPQDLKQVFPLARALPRTAGLSFPAERLHFHPTRGFMKGFMDMVFYHAGRFYLVDWKSNYLGDKVTDYGQEPLARAMAENFYVLQYHLYALALHRYLKVRLPDYRYERDFGCVYYFFLRGVDPAQGPQYGIYRDRPEEAIITEMSERLIDNA